MAFVGKVCLSISAIAILGFGVLLKTVGHEGAALCGGRPYAITAFPNDPAPYIELTADGVVGQFLLDYGATRSSLSADAFAPSAGSVRKAAISLPGFQEGEFDLTRYNLPLQNEKKQLGAIGANFLSSLIVQLSGETAFLGARPCEPSVLREQGLVPVAQNGFFSSDVSTIRSGLPNVPVVFLRLGEVHAWAQIDTGYADSVYQHSVDINEALYDLLVESGIRLERLSDVSVWTCDGSESRRVLSVKDRALVIENEQARPIVQTESYHLILKSANGCGGIGEMTEPAAQLGASFLKLFGTIVFDPKSGTVWLDGAGGQRSMASGPADVP